MITVFNIILGAFILVSQNPTWAQERQTPDGMAVIVTEHGSIGQGFVAGSHLVSSAHGLTEGIAQLLIFQGGRLIDFTQAIQGPPTIHPNYRENSSDALAAGGMGNFLNTPYDVGVVKLDPVPESIFILDPSESLASNVHAEYGVPEEYYVARVDLRNAVERNATRSRVLLDVLPVEITSVPDDVTLATFRLDSDRGQMEMRVNDFTTANALIEGDLGSRQGDSGSPIFARIANGRLFVLGFNSSSFYGSDLNFEYGSHTVKTVYTLASAANAVIEKSTSAFGMCRNLLRVR